MQRSRTGAGLWPLLQSVAYDHTQVKDEGGKDLSGSDKTAFVVAGVDGSEASKDALRWAAVQARLTGAELHAVHAWQMPSGYGWAPDYSDIDFAAEARKRLDATVVDALGRSPDVAVFAEVHEGHPATVLIDASRGAEMLVLGSRGHGAFTGMLLGSVSQHCTQHATCPVLIMRGHPD